MRLSVAFRVLIVLCLMFLVVPHVSSSVIGDAPVCSPSGFITPWNDNPGLGQYANESVFTWAGNGEEISCTGKYYSGSNIVTGTYPRLMRKGSTYYESYKNPFDSPYVTGSSTTFTMDSTGKYCLMHKLTSYWTAECWVVNGTAPIRYPTASFTGSPTSGYNPLNVTFTDSSSNTPTSWYWEFGDGNTSTLQNPSHVYLSSGTYNVNLKATNSAGSDWENKTSYITVNSYNLPVCSFKVTDSVYIGNSPLHVYAQDTSTNSPTSYYWDFNLQDFGWFSISPQEYNTTANPDVIITGTGVLPVYHSVSNPAGTSVCPVTYFNISGPVPTPTPTPNIPFPNQTGVCMNSPISLGSNSPTDFVRYAYLIDPDGNQFTDYFNAGDTVILSGVSYTQKLGQYYYAEKNESGQLLFQSSYVTVNCAPTPTNTVVYTTVPTPHVTIKPSKTPVPVVTTFAPSDDISSGFDYDDYLIPTLEPTRDNSNDVNITQLHETVVEMNPLFAVYVNTTEIILYPFYHMIVEFFTWVFGMLFFIDWAIWAINTEQIMLESMGSIMFVSLIAFELVIDNIPPKVQNVITFCLLLDFLRQVYNLKRGDRL